MAEPLKSDPITGNTTAALIARAGAVAIGGALVGIAGKYATDHGFKLPDADTMKLAGQVVAGAVMVGYAIILGQRATARSEAAVVANTVQAAITNQVPVAIAAQMTEDQAKAVDASPVANVAPIPVAPPKSAAT